MISTKSKKFIKFCLKFIRGNKEQKKNKTALSKKDAEKQDLQEEKTPPRSNIKPQEKKEEAPKTMLSNKDFLAFLKKK